MLPTGNENAVWVEPSQVCVVEYMPNTLYSLRQPVLNEIICWLTGYSTEEIEGARNSSVTYGDFFQNAPYPNPNRKAIKGVVCGIRVETIDEPLMQEIRYLDKLIDELARGKSLEKILHR